MKAMKRLYNLIFAAAIIPAMSACHTEPYSGPVKQQGVKPADLSEECEWIYDELCKSYYWREEVKAVSPRSGLEYNVFLSSLLSGLKGAQDNSESPATIDGSYTYSGGRYTRNEGCYSYIERFDGSSTRAGDNNMETAFGFDVISVSGRFENQDLRYALLVNWVQPGSPADGAGMERGMWIYEYDNGSGMVAMDKDDSYSFWYKLHYLEGGLTIKMADDKGVEYTVTAAPMKNTPIIHHEVISGARGKKVAYLVYNEFVQGDEGEFDNELREIFGGFKAEDATELILDLRYNLGGAVTSSRLLASLAGNVNRSQTFASLVFNDAAAKANRWPNPEIMKFTEEANSLRLSKIYVLTTGLTASSSELVINSLRGVLGNTSDKNNPAVTIIGERTEGKNVGMTLAEKTIDGYRYEMWPITFKTENAKGFCNYAGGFEPNYYLDEFNDVREKDILYNFGDPQERLLKAALTLIDGGSVAQDRATRSAGDARKTEIIGKDPRRGGAKIVRNENGEIR
jgi:C-terminal processing protease CtpA/Prc